MSNSHRKSLVSIMTILGIVTCGLLGVGAGTASAGAHGQKINYYSRYAGVQCTTGANQNSETVRRCTDLRIGSNLDQGFLWVGPVTIIWYYPDHTYLRSSCEVPESQATDYTTCYDPITA